jgi:hypothetical protein
MADPLVIAIPENTWTKVATNVTNGMVHLLTASRGIYLQTYRLTGEAAPTLVSEGVRIFDNEAEISSESSIDVYIYCQGEAGSVRVDI